MSQVIIVHEGQRYLSVKALDTLLGGISKGAVLGTLTGDVTQEQAHAVGATVDTVVEGIVLMAFESLMGLDTDLG